MKTLEDTKSEWVEARYKITIFGKEYIWENQRRRTVYDDTLMIALNAGPQKYDKLEKLAGIGSSECGRAIGRLKTRGKIESNTKGRYKRTKSKYNFHYKGASEKPE